MSSPSFPKPPAPLPNDTDSENVREISKIEKQIAKLVPIVGDNIDGQISQLINKAGILYSQTSTPGERGAIKIRLVAIGQRFRKAAIAAKGQATHKIPAHDSKKSVSDLKGEADSSIKALQSEAANGDQNRFNQALSHLRAEIRTYDLLEGTP
jgi:hypothetical protein